MSKHAKPTPPTGLDPKAFEKNRRPTTSQMRAAADQRFDDADALIRLEKDKHAIGALYVLGYVVEILLKTKLLQKYGSFHALEADARANQMFWKSHDLLDLIDEQKQLAAALQARRLETGQDALDSLRQFCGVWQPFARYTSRRIKHEVAAKERDRIKMLKEYLK